MNASAAVPGSRPTIALFVLLFAIGSVYLASLVWFIAKGSNFIDVQKTAAATRFARSTQLTLPAKLTFSAQSRWSKALATGWNQPEGWGVFSDNADADVVLPAIAGAPSGRVCFRVRVGAYFKIRQWPMTITVNGHALTPTRHFSGKGPFVIQGAVPVAAGQSLHVRMVGPNPKVPNLVTNHSSDPRRLAYSLLGITISPTCRQP